MNDIAARAGVSQATVSFVLNDRQNGVSIPLTTRERVLAIANELGYRRNQLARAVVTGRNPMIGVLTIPNSGGQIVRVLVGALEAANRADYFVKMLHFPSGHVDDSVVSRCLEWRLAGVIIVGLGGAAVDALQAEFRRVGIPVAFVDDAQQRMGSASICSDDAQGIGDVVRHLLDLGHRRIAFLGGRRNRVGERREESFRALMQAANITVPEHWVRHSSWGDPEPIEQEARALLTAPESPTAIVCAGDTVAMAVMRTARSLGLRVPADLSVTGYSNATLSEFADPALTTVDQPFQEMGYAAAAHLIQVATTAETGQAAPTEPEEIPEKLLPTRLIVRGSTAPPKL